MALSLYDPGTQSVQRLQVDVTFEVTTAAVAGGPSELSALRRAVLSDVLRRQLKAHDYRADPALDRALEELARGALRDGCERETLRLWLLEVHYRTPLSLEEGADAARATRYPALDESEQRLAHLYATQRRLAELPVERVVPVQTAPSDLLLAVSEALSQALENDLDTPSALRVMDSFLSAVNAMCDAALRKHGHINRSAVDAAEAGFATLSRLLGLGAENPVRFLLRVRNRRAKQRRIDVIVVERTVAERSAARAARDFERADRLQAELLALGVSLLDGPSGTTWTLA
jgi:cysteinyl-tRNA synthetase